MRILLGTPIREIVFRQKFPRAKRHQFPQTSRNADDECGVLA
jgi:hypothetical protein